MAREDKKDRRKGYEGPRLPSDSVDRRIARATRNSQDPKRVSNEMFAASDTEFREACDRAGIDCRPTKRQASKFRNGYGLAARAVGRNTRRDPDHG